MVPPNRRLTKLLALTGAVQVLGSPVPPEESVQVGAQADAQVGSLRFSLYSQLAIQSLNKNWYDEKSGLWNDLWWNSGNALTMIADFAKLRPLQSKLINSPHIIQNTFEQAQKADVLTYKTVSIMGMVETKTCVNGKGDCSFFKRDLLSKRRFVDFLNDYYDDEGWWALGLMHSYDATGRTEYLDAAVTIFKDMLTGLGGPCNGGIFWSKERKYVNAIANELYLSVAAGLANRIPSQKAYYTKIAKDQWTWFANSGMINSQNLINDGLDDKCKNNNGLTWSYNQGVVLGGLTELYHATGDKQYLSRASTIAKAAIKALSNENGVLVEVDKCEFSSGRCGQDGQQFKGIFVRNLGYLHEAAPDKEFRSFILRNADAIWNKDRDSWFSNKLGVSWDGPYFDTKGPAHSSAMDVLIAAVSVA